MPDRLTLLPLPTLCGERVILREGRESDVDDRLRHPIDPEEEDGYGSSWRREWDGRGYHTREHLATAPGPARPGSYAWAVEYEGHCIGSAGLGVDADQHCASYTVGVFVAGLRGQRLGQQITRLVLSWAFTVLGLHRVELEVLASNSRAIGCYLACGFRQEGVRREAGLYPDGWKDFLRMAVLQHEHAAAARNASASGLRPAGVETLPGPEAPAARRRHAGSAWPNDPDREPVGLPPILRGKAHQEESVFTAGNLLREARRQRHLPEARVPAACLLDPDGDVVRHLAARGAASQQPAWACYHTRLWTTSWAGVELGVVPFAVGAPFAVLVAEELAACGANLVISVSSAGQVIPLAAPPYFVVIEKAWRDEGTSLHYQPGSEWSSLQPHLAARLAGALEELGETVFTGASWTTDAPFRETPSAIAAARAAGVHAVEMEAAALYAYAAARRRDVVCVAHVTNVMAIQGDDFDKGERDGTDRTLSVAAAIATAVTGTRGDLPRS
jgi:RimJ/RimL family protein N-acetyltransferase/uridine phosphorylase